MTLQAQKQHWESLGKRDPLWAVCTDPERSQGRWDTDEFFATGEEEIQTVLECLSSLGVICDRKQRALDFGCGPGRLTRALSMRFDTCYGVDIASTMIDAAKRFNADRPNCHFVVNDSECLTQFPDQSCGFIYSSIVLQHIEPGCVNSYLRDFARLLQPSGVLVFQMPSHRKAWLGGLREKLQLRAKLQRISEGIGGVVRKPGKNMLMHCLREERIRDVFSSVACRVLDVRLTNSCEPDFNGRLRYVGREPGAGYISKQYVVIKNSETP